MLDPDAIAKSAARAGTASNSPIQAGRIVLRMCAEFLQKRESFLVETTLSGNTYLKMMKRASGLGYKVRLIYVGTESVEINIQRIRDRVLAGEHDVPEEDQRRRYPRSLANLNPAWLLAHEVALFDNSSAEGHRIFGIKDKQGVSVFPPVPRWAKALEL